METEVINTLANSTNVVILILLASGPLFGAGIIFVVYRLINKFGDKFGDRFVKAMDDIAEQVKQTKELISSLYRDVDEVKEELSDVKDITTDNNRRLEIIEKTGLKKDNEK